MGKLSSRLGDNRLDGSLAYRARLQRMHMFRQLIAPLKTPLSILDVGGEDKYWQRFAPDLIDLHRITVLNLSMPDTRSPQFAYLSGDARRLDLPDGAFDLVYSNSVIEHVGDFNDQRLMANEIQRVARWHFVQTPNYWFPVEPHYLIPGFQWMPVRWRVFLLHKTTLSRFGRKLSYDVSHNYATRIFLLTKTELRRLFPTSTLVPERVGPFVKSWMVHNLS
jgi:hypothetical protein